MVQHLRRHAVGYVALFVALGGTSYAAVRLPANSVGTAQIKPNAVTVTRIKPGAVTASRIGRSAVTGGAIASNAVTGSKVKNGSLTGADIAPRSLTGANVAPDSLTGSQIDESTLGVVPDSDRLGDIPASGYLQGSGRAWTVHATVAPGTGTTLVNVYGYPHLYGACASPGQFSVQAGGDQLVSTTWDMRGATTSDSGTDVGRLSVTPGLAPTTLMPNEPTDATLTLNASDGGSRILQLQGVVALSGGNCDFRLQALLTTAAG